MAGMAVRHSNTQENEIPVRNILWFKLLPIVPIIIAKLSSPECFFSFRVQGLEKV